MPGSLPLPPPCRLILCLLRASGPSPRPALLTGPRTFPQEPNRLAVAFKIHQQQLPPARIFLLSKVWSYVRFCHIMHRITFIRGLLFKKYPVTTSTRQLLHVVHGEGNASAARFLEGSPPGDEPGCGSKAEAPERGCSVRGHPARTWAATRSHCFLSLQRNAQILAGEGRVTIANPPHHLGSVRDCCRARFGLNEEQKQD